MSDMNDYEMLEKEIERLKAHAQEGWLLVGVKDRAIIERDAIIKYLEAQIKEMSK